LQAGAYLAGIGGGLGFVFLGLGALSRRQRIAYAAAAVIVMALLGACGGGGGGSAGSGPIPDDTVDEVVTGLKPGTTYHWKVVAEDGKGETSNSDVWSFTTK